ncbi:hypothetical protein ZIOFF_004832 [Zingiber officinale]|uniref:Pre-mRNA-splicing factor SYF1 n=1 Tax=Zingiber officinale TaxID=94328 RepID=A0A8J5HTE9_ZINOF|nr:hypothetical protein ZIOFF_004832 [Zingiber officinale]
MSVATQTAISSPFRRRAVIYERALKALPGSYKLWHAYLRERLEAVRGRPVNDLAFDSLNNTFERALVTMHKMPRIWLMYLASLSEQRLLTRARRTFDRALRSLPVTQHDRIWEPYLTLVSLPGVPVETSLRVFRRYLLFDLSHIEDFINFLIASKRWQEAAERLAGVLNDNSFRSIKGKTRHQLWLELCDLLTHHATEVSGLNVDAIIRSGIRRYTDEVGRLWTSLADYYVRRGLYEKARDIFEEGVQIVTTVRDFSVIFESYAQFEQSGLEAKMETAEEEKEDGEGEEDERKVDLSKLSKKFLHSFWLNDDNDTDLRMERFENLLSRRPELLNSVLLRQNPHNVEQWHRQVGYIAICSSFDYYFSPFRLLNLFIYLFILLCRRVKIFENDPAKQVFTYTEAVRTIDPLKAVGKPHTLWVAFARLYESHNDLKNARDIFEKAVNVNYKAVNHLATVWCEYAEMELRHKEFRTAIELMRKATAEPSVEVKRRVAADGNEPVQMKLHKSLRLWSFYVDLEESLGMLESTRIVYERILDLQIATPQIILNYAFFLEENKYFEDAFKVYERGVKIFKYPHVKDIWVTYLSKFVKRYGKTKLERVRELFEHAIEQAPENEVKPIFLQYAKLEEEYGLAKRAMKVYDQAVKTVPDSEKLSMYEIYIARAASIFGVPKTREIYQQAIESGLHDNDAKKMCLKYAELEKNLGEIDRARAIYVFASQFADPRSDPDFWKKWKDFEIQHGNEDTFREMLRIGRSVSASYSQTHVILPEYLMQKDQKMNLEEAVDTLKRAGVPEDEMAALERQLAPATNNLPSKDGVRTVSFVSAGSESQSDGVRQVTANSEDIELPEESDSDDEKIEISQKDVPASVFGDLANKRALDADHKADAKDNTNSTHLGALERIKRQRQQ